MERQGLCYVYVTAFQHIKLVLDEFLKSLWRYLLNGFNFFRTLPILTLT